MAAIQIHIRGQGTVPDEAVPEIRARVTALLQACADAGAPELLRVDFAPDTDLIVDTAAPRPPDPEPSPAPSAPVVPFEAAVLERPTPTKRVPPVPHEPKAPAEPIESKAPPAAKEDL